MTKQEIQQHITANPKRVLYLLYGDRSALTMHVQVSKTALLKNAKLIHSVRALTYGQERPDLDPKRHIGLEQPILTFDATRNTGKTLEEYVGLPSQPKAAE